MGIVERLRNIGVDTDQDATTRDQAAALLERAEKVLKAVEAGNNAGIMDGIPPSCPLCDACAEQNPMDCGQSQGPILHTTDCELAAILRELEETPSLTPPPSARA